MKKVLVIDDHRETVELVRSLIMASRQDAVVLAASSAEVGLRVMSQTAFDLLIADERLPGMRGFELVRTVRKALPDLPIIMITGYTVGEGRQRAMEVGVNYFLEKPFSAYDLLGTVAACLERKVEEPNVRDRDGIGIQERDEPGDTEINGAGESNVAVEDREPERYEPAGRLAAALERRTVEEADVEPDVESVDELDQGQGDSGEKDDATVATQDSVPGAATGDQPAVLSGTTREDRPANVDRRVRERLSLLMEDTGARLVMLASALGEVETWTGDAGGLPIDRLAQAIAQSAAGALSVSEKLESDEPFAIQYQTGRHLDLFSANIGRHHCLAVLLSAQAGRGRIGPVWLYTQRAVPELRDLLYEPLPDVVEDVEPDPEPDRPALIATAEEPASAEAEPVSDVASVSEDDQPVEFEPALEQDLDLAEEPELDSQADEESLAVVQPIEEEDIDALLEGLITVSEEGVDLDSFWDEALSAELDEEHYTQGITLEEARAQGLIPGDLFDHENDSENGREPSGGSQADG